MSCPGLTHVCRGYAAGSLAAGPPSQPPLIFLSSRLSRALIVVQTNPAHNMHITITLFLTYLLRPVPSDVKLFMHHDVF